MKFKTQVLLLILMALLMMVLLGLLIIPNNIMAPVKEISPNQEIKNQPIEKPLNFEGIKVDSPIVNAEVSSPIKITGAVNGGGWIGFEGQVGTVQLLDYKGNKVVGGVLKATTDWTKNPIQFETNLTFTVKTPGSYTLLFSNENPSGDKSKDKKFGLSIKIK
jgi:hypothetical protein